MNSTTVETETVETETTQTDAHQEAARALASSLSGVAHFAAMSRREIEMTLDDAFPAWRPLFRALRLLEEAQDEASTSWRKFLPYYDNGGAAEMPDDEMPF